MILGDEQGHFDGADGTPLERRVPNRAIFQRIEIGEDGKITGTALTPTYHALLAWQPDFGQPQETQGKTGPRSVLVRPSSGPAGWAKEPLGAKTDGAWRTTSARRLRGSARQKGRFNRDSIVIWPSRSCGGEAV